MGGQRVLRHQLERDLAREVGVETARLVDLRQFLELGFRLLLEGAALAFEVGGFGIGLG